MSVSAYKSATKALSSIKKAKYSTSIYVDLKAQTVHFFLMPLADRSAVLYESKTFRSRTFDQNFFKALTEITSQFSAAHPETAESVVTLVLPDYLFATDTIVLPSLNRKALESSLDVMLDTLYKNRNELEIKTEQAHSLKKNVIYSMTAFNRSMRSSFASACGAGKMVPDCITFRSAAYGDAVSMLDSKYSSSSYLMLDIKQSESTFMFVSKGRVTGYYPLPFGYKVLQRASVAAENLLIDHDNAELVVLNAKEKAKAKQLTMMRGNENPDEQTDGTSELDSIMMSTDPTAAARTDTITKELPKKVARNIPKYVQRPAPKTPEEVAYENFNIFMKWALNLIQSNEKLVTIGEPETILVNIPKDLAHVLDTANEEKEENGITFTRLDIDSETETVREHIELYGGLFAPTMNKINNF